MEILTAEQMSFLDRETMLVEPISSYALMRRASAVWAKEAMSLISKNASVLVCAGKGNNGGDGWCVAKILCDRGWEVMVVAFEGDECSRDNIEARADFMRDHGDRIQWFRPDLQIGQVDVIIDAIFGYGLRRKVEGAMALMIDWINHQKGLKLAIDLPSGMHPEQGCIGPCVKADYTLTFDAPKLSFFFEESGPSLGSFQVLDIGLDKVTKRGIQVENHWLTPALVRSVWQPRHPYAHKGQYGPALLIGGGQGMMGALLLAAQACLRSGVGLLTVHVPRRFQNIVHIVIPEVTVDADPHDFCFSEVGDVNGYKSVAVGPGMGMAQGTVSGLKKLLKNTKRGLILDADALNIISAHHLLHLLPFGSVLTPHKKEFERLFGISVREEEKVRWAVQRKASLEYGIYIVAKGPYTRITTPDGRTYFNTTGNAGLARGGSGDILTGMICGLAARMDSMEEAILTAVYLHGVAGELASARKGMESAIGRDVIEHISEAFQQTVL